jgi:hypothetical protein
LDYSKHYELLIARARKRLLTGYVEVHHVQPLCMGGADVAINKVRLTPEEHYVAHQLLYKMHSSVRGLAYALVAMTGNPHGARKNKLYGWIRRQNAIGVSIESRERWQNEDYRAKHRAAMAIVFARPEHRVKMSRVRKGRVKSDQERANIAEAGRDRAPRSICGEALERIRTANRENAAARKASGSYLVSAQKTKETRIKNGSYEFSVEHRTNIAMAGKGRVITDDQRAKISVALKGRKKSPEHVAKVAASNKKPAAPTPTPEQLAQRKAERSAHCSEWQKGRVLPDEHKAKIAAGLTQAYVNGRRGALSKLSDDDVRAIRALLQQPGIMQKEIAARYGISQGSLSELKSGKSYRHVKSYI